MIQQAYKYVRLSLWPCLTCFKLKITNILLKSIGWRLGKSELPWERIFFIAIDLYHAAAILSPRGTKSFVFARPAPHWMRGWTGKIFCFNQYCVIKIYWRVSFRTISLPNFNVLHCKLAKIALSVYSVYSNIGLSV